MGWSFDKMTQSDTFAFYAILLLDNIGFEISYNFFMIMSLFKFKNYTQIPLGFVFLKNMHT